MAQSAFQQRFIVPWDVVTVNTTGTTNKGFFTNAAGTTTVSLPATALVGDEFNVGTVQGDFQVTQAASQQILLSNGVSSTAGAGGTVTSNAVGDALKLVCSVANLTWVAVSTTGTMTVV